jgi:putative FmdB family regulatory protein
MPLYEYKCDKCGARVEIIQRVSDPPYSHCPKCGANEMKKQFSAPAIQFKGSGFYKTDYASKRDAGGESKSSEAKSEKKSDTGGSSGSGSSDTGTKATD